MALNEIEKRLVSVDRMAVSHYQQDDDMPPIAVNDEMLSLYRFLLNPLHRKLHWEERERNPLPFTPTIGAEIEVFEHKIPRTSREIYICREDYPHLSVSECYQLAAEGMGIPQGKDGIYEFTFNPANSYLTLSREVYYLYLRGFLDPRFKYETHFTLGGINVSDEAHLIMSAVAACGWSSDSGRLREGGPYEKGAGGVMNQQNFIELSNSKCIRKVATELRVFYTQGVSGFMRTARALQRLGRLLIEHESGKKNSWPKFKAEAEKFFEENFITNVQHAYFELGTGGDVYIFGGCKTKGTNSLSVAMEDSVFIKKAKNIVLKYI